MPICPQVTTLTGWKDSIVRGQEVGCEVQAVRYLKQHGHPDAVPLCKHNFYSDGQLKAELDAGAVASGCAVLVEKKPKLTLNYVNSAKKTFDAIKYVLHAPCCLHGAVHGTYHRCGSKTSIMLNHVPSKSSAYHYVLDYVSRADWGSFRA